MTAKAQAAAEMPANAQAAAAAEIPEAAIRAFVAKDSDKEERWTTNAQAAAEIPGTGALIDRPHGTNAQAAAAAEIPEAAMRAFVAKDPDKEERRLLQTIST